MFKNIVPRKKGSAAIYAAIGQFEAIAKQIEDGVADNEQMKAANNAKIALLTSINGSLDDAAAQGRSVASKLRALVS